MLTVALYEDVFYEQQEYEPCMYEQKNNFWLPNKTILRLKNNKNAFSDVYENAHVPDLIPFYE